MKHRILPTLLVLILLAVAVSPAVASGGYNLSWWTVDGGGGTSASSGYSLSGTVGQSDAGELAGGTYQLSGGFWPWLKEVFWIYLPLVTR
jgi:hypothetical protein